MNKIRIDEKYIITEKNQLRIYWEPTVIFFAIYNSLKIPLDLCFTAELTKDFPNYNRMAFLDALIDMFFALDLAFTFASTFRNSYGYEVKNSIEIA